jgi:hypothetical protein
MIDIVYGGNKYRFCKGGKRSYWLAINRGNQGNSFYPGNNCVVPVAYWSELQKAAIASGASMEDFMRKKEKKVIKSRKKKSKGLSISIF